MSHLPALLLALAVSSARAASLPDPTPPADPPLVAAVKAGDLSGLKAAIAAGAAVGDKDKFGWTAVMWAIAHGGAPMTQALLNAGADPAPKGVPFDAMIEAAKGGRFDVVPLLAAKGLSCSEKDELGVPALSYAVSQVSTATALALIGCKADVNAPDSNGFTPLIRAVQAHQSAEVRLLIASGARLNVRDGQGYTALMWAAHNGFDDAAQALLAAKADHRLRGKNGQSARDIAQKRGSAGVAAVLPATP